jgi:uncharacterized protein (TIGR03067 family)
MLLLLSVGLGGASADIRGEGYLLDSNTIEQDPLEGTWVLAKATWCGRVQPFTEDEKKNIHLFFSAGKFKEQSGADIDEGTYRLESSTSPKHLDLKYTTGNVLAIRRCIFEVEGDDIRIAYSLPFLPGTPEQEIEEAKKMFAKRPKSFDFDPKDLSDSTLVLVFRRAKP